MTTPSFDLSLAAFADTRTLARPREGLSLRRSVSWTLVGRALYTLCQWSTLLVLARMGGPEAVGRFALALAITAPVVLFSNLGLRHVQATDTGGAYVYADYVAVRTTTTLLALAAIAAIALLGDHPRETALVLVLVGLAKAFESMSDVVYGLAQVARRLDLMARSMALRGVAGVLGLSFGYWLTGQLAGGVATLTAAWAATYLVHDLPRQRRLLAERRSSQVPRGPALGRRLRLVQVALPMGAVALLASLNVNIPRYFIEAWFGEAALGAFAAMAYFVVVGSIVVNSVGQAALVVLADHHAAGRQRAFDRLLGRMLGVSLALAAAGVAVSGLYGREVLTFLYGEAFAAEPERFVCVMVVGGLGYVASTLFYAVTARRLFRGQALLHLVVTGAHLGAAALLVGPFGVLGVIWAWLAAVALQIALGAWLLADSRAARTGAAAEVG